jgi:Mn2+/Fe2+ NRAMP family transporter
MGNPHGSTKPNPLKRFFRTLGPGLITGAADDDPSGVATYTIAGAQPGTSLLWTAFITWPLMGCVQFMCPRIGMVTGRGLAGALRQKIPHWMLIVAVLALFGANSINVGADLSGMADAAEMLTGINSHVFVIIFGVGIAFWTVRCRYYQIAMVLKWLALCLFAYVITAFVVRPDWGAIARDTFVPTWPKEINPVQALFWTAVINGVLAPFLLVGILVVASDRKLMQRQPSSWLSLAAVGLITVLMFGSAAAMFIL